MEEELKTLQRWVDESSRIVFFGGAGVSTESGIPDFRSVDGLYHQQLFRAAGDHSEPQLFCNIIRRDFSVSTGIRCSFPDAQPNAAHQQADRAGGRRES